jgi:hypothetical protein
VDASTGGGARNLWLLCMKLRVEVIKIPLLADFYYVGGSFLPFNRAFAVYAGSKMRYYVRNSS